MRDQAEVRVEQNDIFFMAQISTKDADKSTFVMVP